MACVRSWGGMMINQFQGTVHWDARAYDNTPVGSLTDFHTCCDYLLGPEQLVIMMLGSLSILAPACV